MRDGAKPEARSNKKTVQLPFPLFPGSIIVKVDFTQGTRTHIRVFKKRNEDFIGTCACHPLGGGRKED